MMQRDLNHSMVMNKQKDNKEAYYGIKLVLNEMYGLDLHDSPKGRFRFPVFLSDKLKDVPIETLELSVRGQNCLKRAGYRNLYELFEKVNSKADIAKIRGCGEGTAQEIMEKIFIYQFNSLNDDRRKKYIARIIDINAMD